jgi:hypothetical protein
MPGPPAGGSRREPRQAPAVASGCGRPACRPLVHDRAARHRSGGAPRRTSLSPGRQAGCALGQPRRHRATTRTGSWRRTSGSGACCTRPTSRRARSGHPRNQSKAYIEGDEFALEGIDARGHVRALAIFDKPDPLVGPFFEETIYVTPSRLPPRRRRHRRRSWSRAAGARAASRSVARGVPRVGRKGCSCSRWRRGRSAACARGRSGSTGAGPPVPLEELLLRHAMGEALDGYVREPAASGVMMIPIPRDGVYRRRPGVEEAGAVAGVDEISASRRSRTSGSCRCPRAPAISGSSSRARNADPASGR